MRLARIVALLGIVCVPLSTMAPPQRPEIYSVALVRLRVTNLEVSRPFYANTLGLPQGNQGCFSPQGTVVCFFIGHTQQVELISDAASGGGLEALGFRVSDAATMRKYLVAHGMKCGEVTKSNSGDDVVEVRDPENHPDTQRRYRRIFAAVADQHPDHPRRLCCPRSHDRRSLLQRRPRLPRLLARRKERRRNQLGRHASRRRHRLDRIHAQRSGQRRPSHPRSDESHRFGCP